MTPISKVLALTEMFRDLFDPGDTAGLFLTSGEAIHVHAANVNDIGTLPRCVEITQKYLPLKPGDVVIVNDPYSGGTLSSQVTLLTVATVSEKASAKNDVIIAHRFSLRPSFAHAKTSDEEGLRIPPTPLVQRGIIQNEFMSAIASHPAAPDELDKRLKTELYRLEMMKIRLRSAFTMFDLSPSKALFIGYLQHCERSTKRLIQELPLNSASIERSLEGGAKLCLNLNLLGDKAVLDFSGTTPAKNFAMTDAAAYGACFAAFQMSLKDGLIPNSGSFRPFNVVTPSGTFLNAFFPQPTFLGMTDGVSLVTHTVLEALGRLTTQAESGAFDCANCILDIKFENGKHFFDRLAPGTGAGRGAAGEMGADIWARTKLQASVEEIEKRFPLEILAYGARRSSGGAGEHTGGDGLLKTYRLTQNASLRWSLGLGMKLNGSHGGNSGDSSELTLVLPGGEKVKAGRGGERDLPAGTLITLLSSGGGGYGLSK